MCRAVDGFILNLPHKSHLSSVTFHFQFLCRSSVFLRSLTQVMMFGQTSGNKPPLSWAVFPTVTECLPQKESSGMTGKVGKKFTRGNGPSAAGTRVSSSHLPPPIPGARHVQDAPGRAPDAHAEACVPHCRAVGTEGNLDHRSFPAFVENKTGAPGWPNRLSAQLLLRS